MCQSADVLDWSVTDRVDERLFYHLSHKSPENAATERTERNILVVCNATQCRDQRSPQIPDVSPMVFQCVASVCDAGTTLKHHWANVSSLPARRNTSAANSTVCTSAMDVTLSMLSYVTPWATNSLPNRL